MDIRRSALLWLAVPALVAQAATLEQLTLDEMIQKSTAVVQGHAVNSYTAVRGRVIYTCYRFAVSSQSKGASASEIDVATPGGAANGVQQIFPGAPTLAIGQNYLLFLWTSPSKLTQIIGLSQGLFSVTVNAAGQAIVVKAPSAEAMIDMRTGQAVQDQAIRMPLAELKARIRRVLGGAAQ
jgi:hypothetical protein